MSTAAHLDEQAAWAILAGDPIEVRGRFIDQHRATQALRLATPPAALVRLSDGAVLRLQVRGRAGGLEQTFRKAVRVLLGIVPGPPTVPAGPRSGKARPEPPAPASPQAPAQGPPARRDRPVRPKAPAAPAAPAVEEPGAVLQTATAMPAPEAPTAASVPAAAPPATATPAAAPTAATSPEPAPAPTAALHPATLPPPAMPTTTPIEEPTMATCIIPGCDDPRHGSTDPDFAKLCVAHGKKAYQRHWRAQKRGDKITRAQVVAAMVAEARGEKPATPPPVAAPAPRPAVATLVTTTEDGTRTEGTVVSLPVPPGHPIARALRVVEQLGGIDRAERRVAQLLALLQGA